MKKIYALILLTLFSTSTVKAQYVKNASFEEGLKDWTYSNLESKDNKTFPLLEGDLFVEKWVSSSSHVGNFNLQQTLKNLPVGEYTLTIAAQNAKESTPNVEQTGAWIFAGDSTKNVWKVADYSVTVVVLDGELTIGFRGQGATGNWVACDNVRLTCDETSTAIFPAFLAEIESLEQYLNNDMFTKDRDALQASINAARAIYNSGSTNGMTDCVKQMRRAAVDAQEAIERYQTCTDVTSLITNPSFENNLTGWTYQDMETKDNAGFKLKDGNKFVEKYVWQGQAGNFNLEQTITGLPVGEYTLTMMAQNVKDASREDTQTGAWIFAGDATTTVETVRNYSVKQVVWDGQLTIGFRGSGATGDWVACDNVRLAYKPYNLDNASPSNPYNFTAIITNPSFEDGVTGWVCDGMKTQTNNSFSIKEGATYLEKWLSKGNHLGDCSALQTLTGLPVGKYQLKVDALHVQQGSTETSNTGNPQTGAFLVGGTTKVVVTAMDTYTIEFIVPEGIEQTQIGLIAEDATGNYLCIDNFQLFYIGAISIADYKQELQNRIDDASPLLNVAIQDNVRTQLSQAISEAENALQGNDQTALESALATLITATENAEASHALYNVLEKRIEYAQQVAEWWEDSERKATDVAALNSNITTYETYLTNGSLTTDQLNAAKETLNQSIAAVDKQIYCSGSACGSRTQLENNDSHWSFERSYQSKHWIIFWEPEYGTKVPASVPSILNMCDETFELYANQLGFIKTELGTSKTDDYKMIIRLKSTSDWIAEGSGIDNQIGMLTLSQWAYTSRGGQTVAHEIGHCFQYQVHCDNGDWRGWMFNWGQSTQNAFWEMCAQWMAYVYLPNKLFNDNEWLWDSHEGMHRHPLAGYLRYENFFIQNWFVHKHGWDAVGRLWNECDYGEDPFQTYMRTRMTGTDTQKLNQLADEMWEWGARMTTYDLDPIRELGANSIGYRSQTKLNEESDGFWSPQSGNCIENYGNNAIKLNVPASSQTVYAEFVGEAGKEGYTSYNVDKAGWKYGFVALLNDGTRIYTPINTATYDNPEGVASFQCPGNVKNLWFVVSGAPTSYWTRDLINWGESTAEQWPYRVKFYQTNVLGKTNNTGVPEGAGIAGDVNNDGFVTLADVTSLVNVISGNESIGNGQNRADMNNDGNLDEIDVRAIVNTILNK